MRTSWLAVVAVVSVSGAVVAAPEFKRVTAPEELVKAPKWTGRRFLTGAITHDSTLETFILQRLGDRALLSVETLRAENTGGKIGKWEKLSVIQYLGSMTTEGDVIKIKFSNKPLTLDWTCKKTKVDVAGAKAVRARDPKWKGKECGDPGSWQPAATQKVEVLQCTPDPAPSDDPTPAEPDPTENLAFSAPPGIEWLYINDDCVIQGGGWRRVDAKASVGEVRAKGVLAPAH